MQREPSIAVWGAVQFNERGGLCLRGFLADEASHAASKIKLPSFTHQGLSEAFIRVAGHQLKAAFGINRAGG